MNVPAALRNEVIGACRAVCLNVATFAVLFVNTFCGEEKVEEVINIVEHRAKKFNDPNHLKGYCTCGQCNAVYSVVTMSRVRRRSIESIDNAMAEQYRRIGFRTNLSNPPCEKHQITGFCAKCAMEEQARHLESMSRNQRF
jgi:hypothetical protein